MLKPPTDFVMPDFTSVEPRQLVFARHGSDPKRRASILARGAAGHLGDSRNWSGACITPVRPNQFFHVAGAWRVPEPAIPDVAPDDADPVDPEYRSSTWIGIGGHRPYNTLPQIGTSQHVSIVNGAREVTLGAWWRWSVKDRPEHHVPHPIPGTPVEIGHRILADLTVDEAPGDVHFHLKNQTTGTFVTFKVVAPAKIVPLGATAESIHERPTKFDSRDMYPMPKCSDVMFEHCMAKSAPAFGAPETVQELLNPRLIRMYEHFGGPHRSALVFAAQARRAVELAHLLPRGRCIGLRTRARALGTFIQVAGRPSRRRDLRQGRRLAPAAGHGVRAARMEMAALPAALLGPADPDHYATALAPDIELADRRTMGFGSGRGADAAMRVYRSLSALADDIVERVDDVFALRSDALLVRRTGSGTLRDGREPYERQYMRLWVFGTDGLLARCELFDADRVADALARFDELTAEPPAVVPSREKAQPPRAGKHRDRARGTRGRRDRRAGRRRSPHPHRRRSRGFGASDRRTLRPGGRAVLVSLFAARRRPDVPTRAAGSPRRRAGSLPRLVVGEWVGQREVRHRRLRGTGHRPDRGRCAGPPPRGRALAADRLGDAVVRLYERYAELLPRRPRAEPRRGDGALDRGVRGPYDPDRYATAFAPAIEIVDHRTLGTVVRARGGGDAAGLRYLFELADDIAFRDDDVSTCSPMRSSCGGRSPVSTAPAAASTSGSSSSSGSSEPMASWRASSSSTPTARPRRSPASTSSSASAVPPRVAPTPSRAAKRRVRPNAATANAARLDAAVAAREPDAICTLIAEPAETIDHTTGVTYDREGVLATIRSGLGARELTCRNEALATLGDALALCRESLSASGFARARFDVGAYEGDRLL